MLCLVAELLVSNRLCSWLLANASQWMFHPHLRAASVHRGDPACVGGRAKTFWAMMAAKDRKEDFFDPVRKDKILGRSQTRQELWREHLKDPIAALDEALKCWENPYQS